MMGSMKSKIKSENIFEQRIYAGLRSLAELPYFEITDKGLLRLTVDDLNNGIDIHVHFALNALAGPKPDLLTAHPETKYYLNVNSPISMTNYMGQNQTADDTKYHGDDYGYCL